MELEVLFQKKECLKQAMYDHEINSNFHAAEETKASLNDVIVEIAKICCEKNRKTVEEYLEFQNDAIEGFSQPKTWKLKKKLAPKNTTDPPAAKKDSLRNLITDKEGLEALYLETYINRLEPNKIVDGLEDLKELKEYLFKLRLKYSRQIITKDWTMLELEKVLKSLKNGKARDPLGHTYEIFKYAGRDLKFSLLKLLNLVKRKQEYPEMLQSSNISSSYNNKKVIVPI